MKQLNVGQLETLINKLKQKYPDKYKSIPVYLGNDEELNGIHSAWYCENITENDKDLIDMINEDYSNVKFEDIAILIS